MKTILKMVLLIAVLVVVVGCATTVQFQVYDDKQKDLSDYQLMVDGQSVNPGETVSVSNLAWESHQYSVQAKGYRKASGDLKKEIKIPAVIGGLFLGVPWIWCYGPKPTQSLYLVPDA